jgi:hypothetical protein
MPENFSFVSPPDSPPIDAVLDRIMRQVEYRCFADLRTCYIDPFFKELCLIISEVFVMNPVSVKSQPVYQSKR